VRARSLEGKSWQPRWAVVPARPDAHTSGISSRRRSRAPGEPGVTAHPQPRLRGSEAPLPTSQAAAASLALERTPGCGPIAPPARAARIERARSGRTRGPVLGGVDREPSSIDLAVVKELDRRGGLGLGGELNEREPPGPPGLAIRRQVDLDDVARLGQEGGQRVGGGGEGEVPDEDTGSDGWFLPCRLEPGRSGYGQWFFSNSHGGLRGPVRRPGSPRRTCPRGVDMATRSSRRTGSPTGCTGRSSLPAASGDSAASAG
jgi:hypothetical protein